MENSVLLYEHPVQSEENITTEHLITEIVENVDTEQCAVEEGTPVPHTIEKNDALEILINSDLSETSVPVLEQVSFEMQQKSEENEQKIDQVEVSNLVVDGNVVQSENIGIDEDHNLLTHVIIEEIPSDNVNTVVNETQENIEECIIQTEELISNVPVENSGKETVTEVVLDTKIVEQPCNIEQDNTEKLSEHINEVMLIEEIPETPVAENSNELEASDGFVVMAAETSEEPRQIIIKGESNEIAPDEKTIEQVVSQELVQEISNIPQQVPIIPEANKQNALEISKVVPDKIKVISDEKISTGKDEKLQKINETVNVATEVVVFNAEEKSEKSRTITEEDITVDSKETLIEKKEVLKTELVIEKEISPSKKIVKVNAKPKKIEETKESKKLNENKEGKSTNLSATPTEEKRFQRPIRNRHSRIYKDGEELYIPCHVMGRNVDNPTEDMVSNGRTPPKPRLGVKVPYRNLTSQIVTKQDIANELLERVAKRNPNPDPPLGGDIFFCKKLTSNLASKIAKSNVILKPKTPEKFDNTDKNSDHNILNTVITDEPLLDSTVNMQLHVPASNINDNSDLLAILEGNIEVDWATEVGHKPSPKTNQPDIPPPILVPIVEVLPTQVHVKKIPPKVESPPSTVKISSKKAMDPEMEVKLALKQLKELPKKNYRRSKYLLQKHRLQNSSATEKSPTQTMKVETPQSDLRKSKEIEKVDADISSDYLITSLTPKKVTKTYSRKDPIVSIPDDLEKIVNETDLGASGDKQAMEPTQIQIIDESIVEMNNEKTQEPIKIPQKRASIQEVTLTSKRARVIKRKVIWDPDEFPKVRSPPVKKAEPSQKSIEKPIVAPSVANTSKINKVKTLTKVKATVLSKKAKMATKRAKRMETLKKVSKGGVKKVAGKIIKKKVLNKALRKMKPKMTELDRLLMDEGAINLLCSEKSKASGKSRISPDKAQRELLSRIKAVKNVICNNSQNDTPKTLRKKDSPTNSVIIPLPQRKKSRDSIRSSIQSPPPSPSYMYPQRAEASRIIRRHSSSFSSECSTPRRMSVDNQQVAENKTETKEVDEKKETSTPLSPSKVLRKKGVPIFVRQKEQKTYKGKIRSGAVVKKEKLTVAEKRKLSEEMQKNFSNVSPKKITRHTKANENGDLQITPVSKVQSKVILKVNKKAVEKTKVAEPSDKYKEINLRRIYNLVQIILTSTSVKIKNAFNLQTFKELSEVLTQLSRDNECHVVLITSTENGFCHGVDFSHLIHVNADKRFKMAQEMSKAVKDFLHKLATFPKPLIAGVQGSTVGLGVTMLPLFDFVLASDKATFSTPYGRLGQVPEGATLLTSSHLTGNALTSELFYASRKLTASEALAHGLVTKVLWPDKFQEEMIPIAMSVAKQSKQFLIATKVLLRQSLIEKLKVALEIEQKLLVQHWTSAECQQNFKKMLQENEWW